VPAEPGGTPSRARPDPAEPIDDAERIREREVRRRLVEAAGSDGFLRFDRFVELSLYASGVGFYTEPEAAIGPAAAYYTAAHVTGLFGATVTERILAEYERLGHPSTFTVAEVGCGDGTLGAQVVGALAGRAEPPGTVRYLLVDRSAALRARALERVAPLADGTSVEVRASESLSSDGPFEGVVLANELLDAFPFRRLIRRSDMWRELGVRVTGDSFDWAEEKVPAGAPASELGPAEEGSIAEICPTAEGFLREVSDHLTEGVALIFDYGEEEAPMLKDHPKGTIAALRHHRPMPDPTDHPGLLDLSAFVNFTRLRAAARTAGLEERAFRSQAEALVAWGLERLTETAVRASEGEEETVRIRLAVKNLLFGFSNFRVLEVSPFGRQPPDGRAPSNPS
jgi:SAM-dependent MidA family methyltransferase